MSSISEILLSSFDQRFTDLKNEVKQQGSISNEKVQALGLSILEDIQISYAFNSDYLTPIERTQAEEFVSRLSRFFESKSVTEMQYDICHEVTEAKNFLHSIIKKLETEIREMTKKNRKSIRLRAKINSGAILNEQDRNELESLITVVNEVIENLTAYYSFLGPRSSEIKQLMIETHNFFIKGTPEELKLPNELESLVERIANQMQFFNGIIINTQEIIRKAK